MPRPSPPIALTIAGSDCSSGAGVQADLKTFAAYGVYGLTAVTCVVAEVPGHVVGIQELPAKIVCEQMKALIKAFPVAAMKTGMLYTADVIEAVAEVCAEHWTIPLVVDPVMVATSGDALLQPDAASLYSDFIFPRATLVTPNLDEARTLLGGCTIDDVAAMKLAGQDLCAQHHVAFLMKGGHLAGDEAVDLLCLPGGVVHEFRAPFTAGVSTHGTGCTYAAAITAGLARGLRLPAAVAQAKRYVTAAIAQAFRWERGRCVVDALNHAPDVPVSNP